MLPRHAANNERNSAFGYAVLGGKLAVAGFLGGVPSANLKHVRLGEFCISVGLTELPFVSETDDIDCRSINRDMSPSISAQDAPDSLALHTEHVRQFQLGNAAKGIHGTNLDNLIGCQNRPITVLPACPGFGMRSRTVALAGRRIVSTARNAIGLIVGTRAFNQMTTIAAGRIVASVANHQADGIKSIGDQERHAMSLQHSPLDLELTVSLHGTAHPWPAIVRSSDLNVRPKARDVRFGEFRNWLRSEVLHTVKYIRLVHTLPVRLEVG